MFDPKEFRDALGRFATGVTVITTRDSSSAPIGVTANSYNSVSLDPPLVLWSLAKTSRSLPAFEQAGAFAIHVLSRDQQELARRFASSGTDKFDGLEYGEAYGGAPLLFGCAAHFECETAYRYEGGDHVIIVGRVVSFDKSDAAPLVFHQGKFTQVRRQAVLDGSKPHGRYTDDFLPYLLGRAHFQLAYPVIRDAQQFGMSETHYMTLGLLSMIGSARTDDLCRRLEYTGRPPTGETLSNMAEHDWIENRGDGEWHLTPAGRDLFIGILSRSRALEEDLLAEFDPEQVEEAKAFLRMIIDKSAQGLRALLDEGRSQ